MSIHFPAQDPLLGCTSTASFPTKGDLHVGRPLPGDWQATVCSSDVVHPQDHQVARAVLLASWQDSGEAERGQKLPVDSSVCTLKRTRGRGEVRPMAGGRPTPRGRAGGLQQTPNPEHLGKRTAMAATKQTWQHKIRQETPEKPVWVQRAKIYTQVLVKQKSLLNGLDKQLIIKGTQTGS